MRPRVIPLSIGGSVDRRRRAGQRARVAVEAGADDGSRRRSPWGRGHRTGW